MDISGWTKLERSLLLYLETRAVDYSGGVDARRMNDEDIAIAKRWNDEGFIGFGRIAFRDVGSPTTPAGSVFWCELSDEAWSIVADLRRKRACRSWGKRSFMKTSEV